MLKWEAITPESYLVHPFLFEFFGERTRHRVPGSAPSLNPLPDVSDEGVADHTRGACAPKNLRQDAPILGSTGERA
jgi:hypothetical protein